MFDNISKVLLNENNSADKFIDTSKDLPKEIDDFYQKKTQELADNMIKNHKEFIDKEKDIFTSLWNNLKYSKGTVDHQYDLLTKKYNLYDQKVYGSLQINMDQVEKFMLVSSKDIRTQRNIIQKFIDEKHLDVQKAKFDIDPIAFSTCFLPESDTIISLVLNNPDKYNNVWFMDENRLVSRMVNELKLYNKDGELTSEDIVKLYDNYEKDIKKYFRDYEDYNKKLKKDLELFIDKKQDEYEKEIKIATGKSKELILQKLHMTMDKYFYIIKMLTLHYNIQLKFILESFKSLARTVQKPYDFIIQNYV